jgi:heme-degrading monooxygenase HmoA
MAAGEILAIFSGALRDDADLDEYARRTKHLYGIVTSLPGFISAEAITHLDGRNGLVVRFESEEALASWRDHPEHVAAKAWGKAEAIAHYDVAICQVLSESAQEIEAED